MLLTCLHISLGVDVVVKILNFWGRLFKVNETLPVLFFYFPNVQFTLCEMYTDLVNKCVGLKS
jgi:hypothetical protein